MLKSLIRSEVKEAIILLVFAALLFETLTGVTIGLVCVGALLVWFEKRPGSLFRNIVTLGLFAVYWMVYGKMIDPEIGLNFLTSIIVLKLLEKESRRDSYMIFFGLILIISAGSLFQKSLSYVVFFSLSFFILIQDFYKTLKLPTKLIDLFQALVWVLPLTALLFFFAPRVINPFQLERSSPREGEIGYTPEVNIAEIESLASNDTPVFQALVEKPLDGQDLYWRGNTLSFSDGWNWPVMPEDRTSIDFDPKATVIAEGIKQSIRVFSSHQFYFGLDHPQYITAQNGSVKLNSKASLSQNRSKPSQRYEVISHTERLLETESPRIRANLKNEEKLWINQTFKESSLPKLREEIETYFREQGFSYSLSPGRVENFLQFMQQKKIGFCSHYASAVAQILRTKSIPTRLVSGFLGGNYNKFAGYYLVTHNDAHVWVEAFENGQWLRLDPTTWIAPDRIRLGGEAYMDQLNPGAFSAMRAFGSRFSVLNDVGQWFNQWDFRFYQWLEEMDYYGQLALFNKLNFKREWIFSFIPIILALFMALYAWHLTRKKKAISEIESLWLELQKKLLKRGILLPLHSIGESRNILQDEDLRKIFDELTNLSFHANPEVDLRNLRKKISRL